jgi:hypothetical protein
MEEQAIERQHPQLPGWHWGDRLATSRHCGTYYAAVRLSRVDLAVLDALLPARAHPVLTAGIAETSFGTFLDDFEKASPRHLLRAFRIGLLAAGWLSPVLVRRAPPITRLSEPERERALGAMEASRVPELRQLVSVLKTVVSLHYGALPAVRGSIGYP